MYMIVNIYKRNKEFASMAYKFSNKILKFLIIGLTKMVATFVSALSAMIIF